VTREPRGKRQHYTVDVVALTPRDDQLAVLLERRTEAREKSARWMLPWSASRNGEGLDDLARRAIEPVVGSAPIWSTQVGAFSNGLHPGDSDLSIVYVALVPMGEATVHGDEFQWFLLSDLQPLTERPSPMLEASVNAVRDRLDLYPVAFKLFQQPSP